MQKTFQYRFFRLEMGISGGVGEGGECTGLKMRVVPLSCDGMGGKCIK